MNPIDCHMLALPWEACSKAYVTLAAELESCPFVNLHLRPGIVGNYWSARQLALLSGDAPFVSFADPDDWVHVGAFAHCLEWLYARSDLDGVWTRSMKVTGDDPFHKALRHDFARPHQLIVARRSAVVDALRIYAKTEWDMWARLKMIQIPVVGYIWRDRPEGHHRVGDKGIARLAQQHEFRMRNSQPKKED